MVGSLRTGRAGSVCYRQPVKGESLARKAFHPIRGRFEFRSTMLVEICVESLEGALTARRGGAHRPELSASLADGGVTPSAGLIHRPRQFVPILFTLIIRPREGDFLYHFEQ